MRGDFVRPATLTDVANRAGVSAATVSRVLNRSNLVSRATRERVERAIHELEYVVNGHARALAAAASEVIGVIVGDMSDPFFAHIVAGVQDQTFLAGQLALVCSTGSDPLREIRQLEHLRRLRADGVILVGGSVRDADHQLTLTRLLSGFHNRGARVVLCGRPPIPDLPKASAITFDNTGGTMRLVEHLTALGHKRIGYITGPPLRSTSRERLHGYRIAARDHDPGLIEQGTFTRESGWLAGHKLLQRNDVTAIVAANDVMAAGALAAARASGRDVPGQVSVAGFDDIEFCQDTHPPLTTVRLPLREAGALAGRIACGLDEPPPTGVVRLGAELVVRDTTGPVRE
ncbi:LacI family DNA-binding transcriptional regulator [Kibdelosporangium persicum]|uniref:Mgl repressor and galactose ultrainduction factor n=1 Tax=Kibdelosporangium persicum TaxID=2698649 RepID=A0ABX2F6U5_9PSEU|nr:LacI family DNA-binding transcriptional regulator [Kibdelosporangium persicum]NRN67075.1 Mgl repressor and galactose ultrainduction factor [Kibdelosporangium persicum]